MVVIQYVRIESMSGSFILASILKIIQFKACYNSITTKMYVPEIFKYGSLLSVPLFAIIAFALIKQISDYSLHKYSVSQSVRFLNKPSHALLFRINFIMKGLLDLCFTFYVLSFFTIPFSSPIAILLIVSALLFGSLAYFIEGKYTLSHLFIVYTSGLLWAIGQILLAILIGDTVFILFTIVIITTFMVTGIIFQFLRKVTVWVQVFCVSILYLWIFVFVFQYL